MDKKRLHRFPRLQSTQTKNQQREMSGKLVLLTGGTGFLGRHVLTSLLESVIWPWDAIDIRACRYARQSAVPKRAKRLNELIPNSVTTSRPSLFPISRNRALMTTLCKEPILSSIWPRLSHVLVLTMKPASSSLHARELSICSRQRKARLQFSGL